MAFHTILTHDESGREVKRIVDDNGVVIHTMRKHDVWVSDDEYVHVGKKKELREADEEELSRLGRQPEFVSLWVTNFRYIIEKLDLTSDESITLLVILPYIDWQTNFIVDPVTDEPMNGREIADKTKRNKDKIARGLAGLKRKGVLATFESGKVGNAKHYVINTSLVWKGRRITKHYHHVTHFAKNELALPIDIKYAKAKSIEE